MTLTEKSKGHYVSDKFYVGNDNKNGKFMIKETQNPPGYTGTFVKEFTVNDKKETYKYVAYNYKKVNIYIPKISRRKQTPLPGATFRVAQYYSPNRTYAAYSASERSDKGIMQYVTSGPHKDYYGITGLLVTPVDDGTTGNYER